MVKLITCWWFSEHKIYVSMLVLWALTLKSKIVCFFETSIPTFKLIKRHTSEGIHRHLYHCHNHKFYKNLTFNHKFASVWKII